jgi:peptidoglycan/LPS O-acetylase OafA/YrhL
MDSSKKLYLPNLNSLRFVAAIFVFVSHVEGVKHNLGIENYAAKPFIEVIGKLGVILFFVLSGFLITYLLLLEEKQQQSISVKNFYNRRILRIWPLYFLIVLFTLLAAPHIDFLMMGNKDMVVNAQNILPISLLFLFLLPNIVYYHYGAIPLTEQTWSIGVEEYFYLAWPWLIKKTKNRIRAFGFVFLGYHLLKVLLSLIAGKLPWAREGLEFLRYFNIDCIALGALAAALVFYKQHKVIAFLYHRITQIITLLALVVLIVMGYSFPYMHFQIYSLLFAIVIVNLAFNPATILKLENPVFNYLGKISYGIYMFNFIGIIIALKILLHFHLFNNVLSYALSFIITIGLSALSYHFFESYFLRLKNR